jgi:hypothetical protein
MGREPVAVDILTEIPGVEFDAAWERRVEAVADESSGLAANFMSRGDLKAAERAEPEHRAQDLTDVEAMRKAEESR